MELPKRADDGPGPSQLAISDREISALSLMSRATNPGSYSERYPSRERLSNINASSFQTETLTSVRLSNQNKNRVKIFIYFPILHFLSLDIN